MLLLSEAFCASTSNIWNLLGIVVNIFKIVIPLILIILGMVDLGKAVIASDDKAISKAVSSLIQRFIAAVVMFFVPTIVSAVFNALSIIGDEKDYNVCVQCVTNQSGTICQGAQVCANGTSKYSESACTTFKTNNGL